MYRRDRCPSITETTYSGVWGEVRNHFGPIVASMSFDYRNELYGDDLTEFTDWLSDWNAEHGGGKTSTPELFAEWLIWRCNVGTANKGNLPTRKIDHTGIQGVICPFDDQVVMARAIAMLGYLPSTQTNHGSYYMKVSMRGNDWGFECTYDSCPYLLDNGKTYFYA